jgi:hypothetical protein
VPRAFMNWSNARAVNALSPLRGCRLTPPGRPTSALGNDDWQTPRGACQSSFDDPAGPQIINATASSAVACATSAVAKPRFQYSAPNTMAGSSTVKAM